MFPRASLSVSAPVMSWDALPLQSTLHIPGSVPCLPIEERTLGLRTPGLRLCRNCPTIPLDQEVVLRRWVASFASLEPIDSVPGTRLD